MELDRINYADEKTLSDSHVPSSLRALVSGGSVFTGEKLENRETDDVMKHASLYDLEEMGDEWKFKVPPLKRPRNAKKKVETNAGPKWYNMSA
jgi:hypothetical protein